MEGLRRICRSIEVRTLLSSLRLQEPLEGKLFAQIDEASGL